MKRLLLVFGFLIIPSLVNAQVMDYNLRIYTAGTSTIVSTTPIPNGAVLCNQASPTSTDTKNPDKVVFDDPVNTGRVCIYTDPLTINSPLGSSLKFGNYEGTLTQFVPNSTPLNESPESNRAPFSKTPPALRTVRIIK